MNRRNFLKAGIAVGIGLSLPKGVYAKLPPPPRVEDPPYLLDRKVTPADRAAAAQRAKEMGFGPGQIDKSLIPDIPGVPHYFGPYPNYANSPMPTGPIGAITMVSGGSNYTAPVVTITDVYNTQSVAAAATATVDAFGVITGITLDPGGAGLGYTAPVVNITDASGVGAAATAALDATQLTGGIPKFVDSLAGLTSDMPSANPYEPAKSLGSYIPLATADQATYSGDPTRPDADYYEIGLVQFRQKFHSDLPPTLLRGYVQLSTTVVPGAHVELFNEMPDGTKVTTGKFGVDVPRYLGPVILSTKDKPVRIKFVNLLPSGAGGDLFVPVDESIMGAGMGPIAGENYKHNRATLHNHGALSPWISDGTPHQWTVPAAEFPNTPYKVGDSTYNVPDMPAPEDGAMTFYYTNQQSARLMFYHDHAFGITRLNVYVGEASAYLITDEVEQDLIAGTNVSGVNILADPNIPDSGFKLPGDVLGLGIPLVLQDKTFVDAKTIAAQDPNWLDEGSRRGWGSIPGTGVTGDLWLPNVYMPAQNPWDPTGANAFGRWQYGPWFWPPTSGIDTGPMVNEYYDPTDAPWEPPMRPTMPNPSMGMEAFNDTTMVNGVVYPFMEVDPRTYRFRILNAANDRFFNLHFYEADPAVVMPVTGLTEVKMVPAVATPGFPELWSTDGRAGGVPDPATMGPSWIQIGTEGGFLPAPVVIPPQPINWNMNATAFNVGNVTDHSLLLGNAERADVLVDFSQHAGKTLILYNDAPTAFPALDSRYDYYTGDGDQMDAGGAPNTFPGYGPNTRTIMQIKVANVTGGAEPITGVTVTAGGSDYASAPEVVFTGGGASIAATANALLSLDHITVLTPGLDYSLDPTVLIVGGGGVDAAAHVVRSGNRVTGIIIDNPGSGYTAAPTITIEPDAGDTTGSGATAVALMIVKSVTVIDGGTGYTSLPTVSFVGGGGYDAMGVANFAVGSAYDIAPLEAVFAHATGKSGVFERFQDPILLPQAAYNSAYGINTPESASQYVQLHDFTKSFFNGPLTGLNLTAGGSGYTSAPTVTINAAAGDTGTGATASAAITGAFVNSITLLTKGAGYTSIPTVNIVPAPGDTGTGATAVAVMAAVVQSVTIGNPGTGYTSAPTVRFNGGNGGGATAIATVAGGSITSIVVTNGGSYLGFPTISFSGGGGRNATASPVMRGVVNSLTLTNAGSGYGATPTVTFTGGGATTQATASATFVPGVVTSLTLDTPGDGYHLAPTVVFSGGGPGAGAAAVAVGYNIPLEPKAIHDEMGAAYDIEFGRMGGLLGLELPVTNSLFQNMSLYGYISPPVDLLQNSMSPIGTTNDGTQIWKITQNGVDTHPIHFHLVNVQLVNRVAWDGAMLPPDPNELGWKETVRVNPLEHCIVAMRPIAPTLPFDVPNSTRLIDVTRPANEVLRGGPQGFVDPLGTAAPVTNHMVNFGWEYVWHCHILSHEEMDMMHALSFVMPPAAPSNLAATYFNSGPRRVALSWRDNSVNETHFVVQRSATAAGPWANVGTVPASPAKGATVTYNDTSVARNRTYFYRVVAANTVGDTTVYQLPAIGYPDKTLFSDPTNPGVSIFTNTTGAGGTPIIFANAFAEGALGWAGMVGGVAIIPAAAMGAGAGLGMAAPAPLQQAAGLAAAETVLPSYVYDNSPDNETAYDASFYFNPNGFITPDGPVDIFVGLDQNGVAVFGVQYEGEDEEQELRAWVLQDENMVFVGDVKVSNAPHLIELAWLSGGKAKFSLFFDEQLVGTVTGNTSTHLLNQVMLGAVTGLTAESTGSMYFDEFTSSKIDGSASNKIFFPWLRK